MTLFDVVFIVGFAIVLAAIALALLIADIVQHIAAKRQPPTTTEPSPGITDARNCPTTNNACRRNCAGRCWHEIGP